ncbi:MAG: lipoyl(octanoyl) transferase LipB [Phenylobacterium sp.]|uniref:lipoyl(octanoyl) transferase LipB n=1 Tax=Phenylobacterium sp. TaxID=1871053 RepID=UPI002736CBA9|nr:lipoyl(octanoyl) transferase LipB [Phenylobacterium sp.]MDP3173249.1 lipoyl(octanoyl) transferase LipB [Phenylobacterium sp.]
MLDRPLNSPAAATIFRRDDAALVQWATSAAPVAYPEAVAAMEARVAAIVEGRADELVWLLEHPPLYTAGVSAKAADLLQPDRFEVFRSGRGGQYTYHGPGQRVAYVMLDLSRRTRDVRAFVGALEAWVIAALARAGVHGEVRAGRVGVWVDQPGGGEAKIAALGVKLRRWVSFHGVSINVAPDLEHFAGIVPCGVTDHGVTSLSALGARANMTAFDVALRTSFEDIFGSTLDAQPPA